MYLIQASAFVPYKIDIQIEVLDTLLAKDGKNGSDRPKKLTFSSTDRGENFKFQGELHFPSLEALGRQKPSSISPGTL